MHPLGRLLPFDQALRLALRAARPTDRTERVPVPDAESRVAAETVRSPIDVPLAARAAMDGYAVRFGDLKQDGEVHRGWMGLSVLDLTPEIASLFNERSFSGVIVSDVDRGGPAAADRASRAAPRAAVGRSSKGSR